MIYFGAALLIAAAIIGAALLLSSRPAADPVAPTQDAPPAPIDWGRHVATALLCPDDPSLPPADELGEIATAVERAVEQLASLHLAETEYHLPADDLEALDRVIRLILHGLSTDQLVTALLVELRPLAERRAAALLADIRTADLTSLES